MRQRELEGDLVITFLKDRVWEDVDHLLFVKNDISSCGLCPRIAIIDTDALINERGFLSPMNL